MGGQLRKLAAECGKGLDYKAGLELVEVISLNKISNSSLVNGKNFTIERVLPLVN